MAFGMSFGSTHSIMTMEKTSLKHQILAERECLSRYANSLVRDTDQAERLVEETIELASDTPLEYKDCVSLRGWLLMLMRQHFQQ